jgi:hypothetical protein
MKTEDYLTDELGDKISMRLFRQIWMLKKEYPTKDDVHKITAEVLLKRKGIGKVLVNEFYTAVLGKNPPFRVVKYVYENI